MASDVERIINAKYEGIDAANYADAIVLETEQNSGDDYTLVWTTEYSGGYPPKA